MKHLERASARTVGGGNWAKFIKKRVLMEQTPVHEGKTDAKAQNIFDMLDRRGGYVVICVNENTLSCFSHKVKREAWYEGHKGACVWLECLVLARLMIYMFGTKAMMYKFMTLEDGTEIVHSERKPDGSVSAA